VSIYDELPEKPCSCEETYDHLLTLLTYPRRRGAVSWTCAKHGQVTIDNREFPRPSVTVANLAHKPRPEIRG